MLLSDNELRLPKQKIDKRSLSFKNTGYWYDFVQK